MAVAKTSKTDISNISRCLKRRGQSLLSARFSAIVACPSPAVQCKWGRGGLWPVAWRAAQPEALRINASSCEQVLDKNMQGSRSSVRTLILGARGGKQGLARAQI